MTQRLYWVTIVLGLLTGCGVRLMHYTGYHGDGTFTPQAAPRAFCADGYTLDLGAVDLNAPGGATRSLVGLPSAEALIGLAVQRTNSAESDEVFGFRRPAPLIEITLRDASDRIVLSRRERLTQWIGSRATNDRDHAFLFQRGTEAEILVAPGVVRVERFPVGIDDSWGTYFTPRRGARYTLHFAVEEPDPDGARLQNIDVRLQLRALVGCL